MVIVFGSINLDIVVQVPALPAAGETVVGGDRVMVPGGKGANQALSARRMGVEVILVGAVGRDEFADRATQLLRQGAVDLSHLAQTDRPTGMALIAVSKDGENSIVVSPGANAAARAEWLESLQTMQDDVLVLQCEVPIAELVEAIAWAKRRKLRVLLNLAPATTLPKQIYRDVDFLIVNRSESEALGSDLGLPVGPCDFARSFADSYGSLAVVTLGAQGVVADDGTQSFSVPASDVEVVDTTGAGDAFVGAFAASVSLRRSVADSLEIATAAAGLACTSLGAQQGVATIDDVSAFLASRPRA